MEVYRKTVDSELLLSVMELPESMRQGKVEVVVFPAIQQDVPKHTAKSMKGFLKKYADPTLVAQEKETWETNAKEKQTSL
ncbi:MAG: hypothetical protein FWF53_11125 [Candidatus Azobacteroides sp.]|nr:hypothetical protein [Candidatus Azobacteroides sp.]